MSRTTASCPSQNAKCVISAHDSPLAALAWSMCGRRLATASERGTVIRVFAVPERTRLYEFRRGVKRCVSIACLAFSACGSYLAATSNTETVHVFRLTEPAPAGPAADEPAPAEDEAAGGWMGWLSSAVSAGAGYLPAQVADVLAQGRAFAAARLPHTGYRAVAAITSVARAPRLLVATAQGVLYVYALDAEGGDCTLLRQHQFLERPAAAPAPQEGESRRRRSRPGGPAGAIARPGPPRPHIASPSRSRPPSPALTGSRLSPLRAPLSPHESPRLTLCSQNIQRVVTNRHLLFLFPYH